MCAIYSTALTAIGKVGSGMNMQRHGPKVSMILTTVTAFVGRV